MIAPSVELTGKQARIITTNSSTRIGQPPTVARWRRVATIARNAFRESVRDRVLYNLVLFVLLLIAGSLFLGELTAGQEVRAIVNIGLSASLMFGVFIAIFVGVGLVAKEIEKRTVYFIFAKPVGRGEFILGKYLGLCLTLLLNVGIMGLGMSLALLYLRGGWQPAAGRIWPALLLIYAELTVITAIALLFSSFSSPALSALLTFFAFIIGHFSADLKAFAVSLGTTSAQVFFSALYYLLPNLSHFNYITAAANGYLPSRADVLGALLYALLYNCFLIGATILIFHRRNFK